MTDWLKDTCDAVREDRSRNLLRFMAAVYEGRATEDSAGLEGQAGAATVARSLGLIDGDDVHVGLTERGYLVGNVAKEHCHWLDAGRSVIQPAPPAGVLPGAGRSGHRLQLWPMAMVFLAACPARLRRGDAARVH